MKKAGLFLVVLSLVLFVAGALFPEGAKEEAVFIRAAAAVEDTKAEGSPPNPQALDQQTKALTDDLYDRMELKGLHFLLAGAFLFPLGAALWLIGWQRTPPASNRSET